MGEDELGMAAGGPIHRGERRDLQMQPRTTAVPRRHRRRRGRRGGCPPKGRHGRGVGCVRRAKARAKARAVLGGLAELEGSGERWKAHGEGRRDETRRDGEGRWRVGRVSVLYSVAEREQRIG